MINFSNEKVYDPVLNSDKKLGSLKRKVTLSKSRVANKSWNVFLVYDIYYNIKIIPPAFAEWQKQYMCNKCGTVFNIN